MEKGNEEDERTEEKEEERNGKGGKVLKRKLGMRREEGRDCGREKRSKGKREEKGGNKKGNEEVRKRKAVA